MSKTLFRILVLISAAGMSQGCVTTTTNQPVVNVDAAHATRIELGMKYLAEGMRDNARFHFSKALKLKDDSALAYQGIAMVHQANGELEPAESNFKKALKYASKQDLSSVNMAYGKYQLEVGKTKEACERFESAAADYEFSARPEALYMAGQCAAKLGNKLREKAAYEHALNLKKDFAPAILELAEIYFVEGQYPKTKRLLSRLDELTKPTPRSLWLGIRIERIFGNHDKEASLVLALKNLFPYSKEYLEYKKLTETP